MTMTGAEYRATMTEAQLDAAIVELAVRRGWLTYHTHRSDRSEPGFPDRVFVRAGRLIFAELKAEKGRMSAAQHVWASELNKVEVAVGGSVRVFLWRPSDMPLIERILR